MLYIFCNVCSVSFTHTIIDSLKICSLKPCSLPARGAHRFFKQGISELATLTHVMICSKNYHFKIPHLAFPNTVKSMVCLAPPQKVNIEFKFEILWKVVKKECDSHIKLFIWFHMRIFHNLPNRCHQYIPTTFAHEQLGGKNLDTWNLRPFPYSNPIFPQYMHGGGSRWRSPLPKCGEQ